MWQLDDTQRAIEGALRQFCEMAVEPQIAALESGEISPFAIMRKLSQTFGMDELVGGPLRRKVSRLRAGGAAEEDERPGLASDPVLSMIFAKELARTSPGLCLAATATVGCGQTIAAKGDAELIERLAIPLLCFDKVGCWALTEPGSGSDAFALRTRATIEGDEVVLHGSKTFISNAPVADVFLIYARVGDDKQRILPVVVERGTPGLETGPAMRKHGMHASPTGEIFLDGCRVPRRHLLGDPDRPARDAAERTLAVERSAVVAMCLGVIERCLDDALSWATTRVQFGKPIGAFQLVQERLARIFVAKQNVQNLAFQLAHLQKEGRATEREVSAAKWYASEAAVAAASDAMQILGGAGYLQDHAPERLLRDIKLWTVGGGSTEIQILTIAKELLRARGLHVDLAGEVR